MGASFPPDPDPADSPRAARRLAGWRPALGAFVFLLLTLGLGLDPTSLFAWGIAVGAGTLAAGLVLFLESPLGKRSIEESQLGRLAYLLVLFGVIPVLIVADSEAGESGLILLYMTLVGGGS